MIYNLYAVRIIYQCRGIATIMFRLVIISLALIFQLLSPAFAKTGELYAVLAQNVGPGLTHRFQKLLVEQYSFPSEHVFLFGEEIENSPSVTGPASADRVLAKLNELSTKLKPDDKLVLLFLCHMQDGFLINNTLSYQELEEALKKYDDKVDIIVVVEGCHSSGAIDIVKSADVLFTSARKGQPCYGGFLLFLADSLDPQNAAFKEADTDCNGVVTMGEAYIYAGNESRLASWYKALDRSVWPPEDFYPIPAASYHDGGESLTLGKQ